MVEGEYLHTTDRPDDIPLIINVHSYVDFNLQTIWSRVELDFTQENLARLAEADGGKYLETFQTARIDEWSFDGSSVYREALGSVSQHADAHNSINALPKGLKYQDISLPSLREVSVLEVIPYSSGLSLGAYKAVFMQTQNGGLDISREMIFRESGVGTGLGGSLPFIVQGAYDIEHISHPTEISEVPLETYFPPRMTLRFDLSGKTIESVDLGPTFKGPLHFLMAGISFLVAGFATADVLLMAAIERRMEIGIIANRGKRLQVC